LLFIEPFVPNNFSAVPSAKPRYIVVSWTPVNVVDRHGPGFTYQIK